MSIATPSEITEARANSSKRYAASSSSPCFFRPSVEKNQKQNQHTALTLFTSVI